MANVNEINLVSEDKANTESKSSPELNKKEKWSTKLEFILTCLSFVIGFGNIWRFPYICYKNGGGAFLIPYILSLIFIGLPIMILEMTLGQYSARGKIKVWKMMPILQGIGISMFIIVSIQGIYYCVLIAWSMYFFFSSFTLEALPWSKCDNKWNSKMCTTNSTRNATQSPSDEYFHNNVLQMNDNMEDILSWNWRLVLCFAISWLFILLMLFKGVKSIGKVAYFTTIFPYVCLVILFIRGILLKGAFEGIKYYLTPVWSKLLVINVWVDACQQIFFSLGVSYGIIITLSSYNDFDNHLIRDTLIIAFGNSLTSIFAGFVIFSFMGSLAYERGVNISDVATQGPGLAFMMYPEAVAKFPAGQIFSGVFFFMLILLGLGSQTPNIESTVMAIFDFKPSIRKHRKIFLTILCITFFTIGLIYCTNAGMYWFSLITDFCSSTSAMIIALVEVMGISWFYGIDKFFEHIKEMVGVYPKPQLLWKFVCKYITPLFIFILLIFTFINTTEPTYRGYVYPRWTIYLGWLINIGSVLPIPGVAAYYLYKCYVGQFKWEDISVPDIDWKTKDP